MNGYGFPFSIFWGKSEVSRPSLVETHLEPPIRYCPVQSPSRDHSGSSCRSKRSVLSSSRYVAEWTGLTTSMSKSILCLATSIRPKYPSHMLLNSSIISKKDGLWFFTFGDNWTSSFQLFFRISSSFLWQPRVRPVVLHDLEWAFSVQH